MNFVKKIFLICFFMFQSHLFPMCNMDVEGSLNTHKEKLQVLFRRIVDTSRNYGKLSLVESQDDFTKAVIEALKPIVDSERFIVSFQSMLSILCDINNLLPTHDSSFSREDLEVNLLATCKCSSCTKIQAIPVIFKVLLDITSYDKVTEINESVSPHL